jgi:NAD(P)-dependent dehydrogenase (short-subunit alcohol dehydrogenase family)
MNAGLFDLTGKNALVTGGAQGLGRMIAEGLLRAGATVAITSRKADICEAAASEMAALGKCIALPADLSTPEAAVDLAQRYRETVGGTLRRTTDWSSPTSTPSSNVVEHDSTFTRPSMKSCWISAARSVLHCAVCSIADIGIGSSPR